MVFGVEDTMLFGALWLQRFSKCSVLVEEHLDFSSCLSPSLQATEQLRQFWGKGNRLHQFGSIYFLAQSCSSSLFSMI